MQCYYKEVFGFGMFATLLIFGAVFLWWDEIEKLWRRVREKFGWRKEIE